MKYRIDHSDYFGYDYYEYDTETLTKTHCRGSGEYKSQHTEQLTAEQMKAFTQDRYISLLESMRYEIAQIQEKYDKKLQTIKEFKKAIDKPKGD